MANCMGQIGFSQGCSLCSTTRPSWHLGLHLSEGREGRRDGAGGLVSTGSEFPESLNLKTGQGISYFIVRPLPWEHDHENEYKEMNQIHDPSGFEMI